MIIAVLMFVLYVLAYAIAGILLGTVIAIGVMLVAGAIGILFP